MICMTASDLLFPAIAHVDVLAIRRNQARQRQRPIAGRLRRLPARRLGGLTGDCLGALGEVVRSAHAGRAGGPRAPGPALMLSTWVYLVRHGEVEHAAEGRFFGHTPTPRALRDRATPGRGPGAPARPRGARGGLRERPSAGPRFGGAAGRGRGDSFRSSCRRSGEASMGQWEGLTFARFGSATRRPWRVVREPRVLPVPGRREPPGPAGPRVAGARRDPRSPLRAAASPSSLTGAPTGSSSPRPWASPSAISCGLAQDYAGWSVIEYRPSAGRRPIETSPFSSI